ncbi:MAG: purine-nucleoside phosphorylase [Alphaproteobacteria bacterium]
MTADADNAAAVIRERIGDLKPRVGIILGSGLGDLGNHIADNTTITYTDLPGFPQTGVEGHAGNLLIGTLGGVTVACLQGRAHSYEGDLKAMVTPVRSLQRAGCEILFATNAAGCLVADRPPGSLMAISDHINLQPGNPLTGPNDDAFGPRFPNMVDAYDPALRALLQSAAQDLGITLYEGVYAGYLGPNFETPAEIRAFRTMGADAVGMSTVPEVLIARHCGLRVAATSVLTNLAAGMSDAPLTHDQTLHFADLAAKDLIKLVTAFLERLDS